MAAAPGPIPYRSIIEFARWHGISSGDEFEALYAALLFLDREWLQHMTPTDTSAPKVSERPMSPELFNAIFG